ncbi:MAG: phosphatidate cytidylyltransferase [Alphaproteobacteria bacterium]|nr:phosphatidate cytidylyltransferase [Alphaproteobacteria bacterium]
MKLRIISAAVLAAVTLTAIWYGGLPFMLLMALAVGAMSYEWTNLTCGPFWPLDAAITAGTAMAAMLAAGQEAFVMLGASFVAGLVFSAGSGWFSGKQYLWRMAGIPYIALGPASLVWLRGLEGVGFTLIFWLLMVVWAMDIGAYFAGRAIGGPKLAPWASPNKTWSGLLGGIACAGVTGAALGEVSGLGPALSFAAAGILLGAWSHVGDIAESMVKRRFGVKDMSRLIPGHGGILDRVDGLLFAAPVMVLVVLLMGSR